ncbi:MAG: hypothetical protein JWN03_338 [Nocardia sp.]|uniref:hypothetical protein n=1 Tax=Nocardia sp. TaxID=1821 RepID=UPI002623F11B|nr:hypothetical protein [Nocardia sp.]MCU1640063.1 hypothetical protein [Nocardia sp.]
MSDQTASPEPQAVDSETPAADRPMSRRERRGKPARKQSDTGPVRAPDRNAIPANKRLNFVKG